MKFKEVARAYLNVIERERHAIRGDNAPVFERGVVVGDVDDLHEFPAALRIDRIDHGGDNAKWGVATRLRVFRLIP